MYESKIIYNSNYAKEERYKAFGWRIFKKEKTEKKWIKNSRGGNGHYEDGKWICTMHRFLDIPHYDELKKLQSQYEECETKIREIRAEHDDYKEMVTKMVLYLMLIIPGIVYSIYCAKKENKREEQIKHLEKKKTIILKNANELSGLSNSAK